jgi:Ca2+-binding RTX toxin-like protein
MDRTAVEGMLGGMRRLATLSLLLPLLAQGPAASAQAPGSCHGQAPTVVGTSGAPLTGTDGDDVMLTGGATSVRALGGDDLICVTGSYPVRDDPLQVRAGSGDDIVDNTLDAAPVEARLGRGVDTFLGGARRESVSTGSGNDAGESVSTGDGRDSVQTGRNGQPMNNTVSLGAGKDYVVVRGLPGTGAVDLGQGRDLLRISDTSHVAWAIDNRGGTISVGDTSMPIEGVEEFGLSSLRWRFLDFRGGAAGEELHLVKRLKDPVDGPVLADLGGGDDSVVIDRRTRGILRGGEADDHLSVVGDPLGRARGSLRVDLARGSSVIDGDDLRTTSFSGVFAEAFRQTTVHGSAAADEVYVIGCRAVVRGAGGDDDITFTSRTMKCSNRAADRSLTAYGDAGADRLVGAEGDDRLIGGAGLDVVDGGPGRDVCSGEKVVRC